MTDLISQSRGRRRAGCAAACAIAPLIALAAPERAAAQQTITYTATICQGWFTDCSTDQQTGYDRTGPGGVVYVNPTDTQNVAYLFSTDTSLEFATPTTTTTVTTDDATEIIAELNGKVLSDAIYGGSLGGASAGGGVAAADAALRAAGGAKTALGAPVLQSTRASSTSTSSTLYSVAGLTGATSQSTVFGPTAVTAFDSAVVGVSAPYVVDPNAGMVDSCDVSSVSAPTSVRPSCEAVDSVPILVPTGQADFLTQVTATYTIATTTTVADVTTDTSVYVIAATTPSAIPEPSTWAMLLTGFSALGLAGWRARGAAGDCGRRLRPAAANA